MFPEEKEAQKQTDQEEKQKRKKGRERKRKAREEEKGKSKKQKKPLTMILRMQRVMYVQCVRFHMTLMNMRKMGKCGYSVVVTHGCMKTAC